MKTIEGYHVINFEVARSSIGLKGNSALPSPPAKTLYCGGGDGLMEAADIAAGRPLLDSMSVRPVLCSPYLYAVFTFIF